VAYGGICTDQTGIAGNISADPLFTDPVAGNYTLQPTSPSIGVGDNASSPGPYDLRGVGFPRILDGDIDGNAIIDMGVFEAPDTLPEIDVLDGSTSILDNTGMASFGVTTVGTPITKIFTVQNLGTADLILTPPITLPVGYTLVSNFGTTTVTPASSTTFEVQLDATIAGVFSGTLAFDNNDLDENPYNFVISGTVLTPTPGYGSIPGVGSIINVGTTTISNTISTILTVQETGTAQLDVGVPGGGLLTGANAGDFAIVNGPPFSVADSGANQVVTIRCTPLATGLRTATLSFTTNDPLRPTIKHLLTYQR